MDQLQENILTLTIFFPVLAGLFIAILPGDAKTTVRRLTLILSVVPLILVLYMWFNYDRTTADMQFIDYAEWFPLIGSNYIVEKLGGLLRQNRVYYGQFL